MAAGAGAGAGGGVNVMVMVQLLSAGTLLPHVLVCVKSPGSVPPMAIRLMLSVFPKFWRVTVWGGADWPTISDGNVSEVGVTFTEVNPLPLSVMVVSP